MWSKERVFTLTEDLHSNACLWDVHCADYKNRNKKVMRLFSCKKMWNQHYRSWEKIAISKVSSGDSIKMLQHPRRLDRYRYFVPLLWILGPVFWSKISKSPFVILTKFLNPEPSSTCNSRRRLCPYWTTSLNKRRVQKRFAYFGYSFLIKNIYPAHISATASLHDMVWLTGHAKLGVDTKQGMRSVRGLSMDIVRRSGLGFTCKSLPHFINRQADQWVDDGNLILNLCIFTTQTIN
jgi:hypothetical protein